MGLFTDIYNTVAKFFRPQEDVDGEASKSVATNRLKLVLMQDRTNLTPKILEQMRSELIDLLSRYVELDKELLELNFEQEGDQVALMLSIPVIRAKDEEEIEAAIKAHKAFIEEDNEEDDDEDDDEEITSEDSTSEDSEEEISEIVAEEQPEEKQEEKTEEEIEAERADAIAKELQAVPTIIKKKKVSEPKDISSNPFKPENIDKVESSTEA